VHKHWHVLYRYLPKHLRVWRKIIEHSSNYGMGSGKTEVYDWRFNLKYCNGLIFPTIKVHLGTFMKESKARRCQIPYLKAYTKSNYQILYYLSKLHRRVLLCSLLPYSQNSPPPFMEPTIHYHIHKRLDSTTLHQISVRFRVIIFSHLNFTSPKWSFIFRF
jgi:hypothetical protein